MTSAEAVRLFFYGFTDGQANSTGCKQKYGILSWVHKRSMHNKILDLSVRLKELRFEKRLRQDQLVVLVGLGTEDFISRTDDEIERYSHYFTQ